MVTDMTAEWAGRRVQAARAVVAGWLPMPCGQCGKTVTADQPWVVGHKVARSLRPDLTWSLSNWRPEHRACSDKTGQAAVIAKARAEGAGFFPTAGGAGNLRLFRHTHREPLEVRAELEWTSHALNAPTWLKPYLTVPSDAAPPLAMTPVHPDATGSYGPAAIEWVEANVTENGKLVRLRWWQRLAFVMQLQHDKDGRLLIRTVVESGPRRIGKSVRLRAMALWRLDHADLFGENQLALHCGKDVPIVREIHMKAWTWAQNREGWAVKKGAGFEEVYKAENRWLVKSVDGVYGYDVCLGMVDEAWGVKPSVFNEGLEPATMERLSPQLLLTSTAHRRSTSLMRKKISTSLAMDDGETLLLLWGARPQDDPADPETWKAASPHWSEERRRMIAAKYAAALAGEVDPEADEPDPMEGFLAQYLNLWRLTGTAQPKGDPIASEESFAELETEPPDRPADAVAVESWFADGVSVAYAWSEGVVDVVDYPDLATAAAILRAEGVKSLTVGASLADDPALVGFRVAKGAGRSAAAVQEFSRFVKEGTLRHTGSVHLTDQVLGLRTATAPDGVRVVSHGRSDAIKAAVWAMTAARKPGKGKPRILLPTDA